MLVLLLSQACGLVLVAAAVLARGDGPPPVDALALGAASAVAGVLGLAAFYRGLAVGAMGVVAPISATGAAIPVAYGILTGEHPTMLQMAGIALAIAGVAMASREPERDTSASDVERPPGRRFASGAGLALLAAVGFGGFFVLMGRASAGGDALWPILANRVAGVSILVIAAVAIRPRGPVGVREALPLLVIGALDVSANALYAIASTRGLVSVVAVLASLYPVVTVALAMAVLREHVSALQGVGAATAIAGAAVLAAG